ncbi:estA, partial [Symbiodinium sp. KB8]
MPSDDDHTSSEPSDAGTEPTSGGAAPDLQEHQEVEEQAAPIEDFAEYEPSEPGLDLEEALELGMPEMPEPYDRPFGGSVKSLGLDEEAQMPVLQEEEEPEELPPPIPDEDDLGEEYGSYVMKIRPLSQDEQVRHCPTLEFERVELSHLARAKGNFFWRPRRGASIPYPPGLGFSDVKDGLETAGDLRVAKVVENSYTPNIEELLGALNGPLEVVHQVAPADVRSHLDKWKDAAQDELDSLVKMQAIKRYRGSEVQKLLRDPNLEVLPAKCVFTVKPGKPYRRKVRIVSCGNYAQGVSEDVLYASGAAAETLRAVLVRCKTTKAHEVLRWGRQLADILTKALPDDEDREPVDLDLYLESRQLDQQVFQMRMATSDFMNPNETPMTGFVSQLPNLLSLPSVRYVLPTAPSLSGMRSWFTTAAMMGGASVGGEAVRESIEYVHVLIRREIARGIPSEKIFVGGFSQGGCIAVQAALSFPDAPLGGCVAASTFLSLGGGPQSVQVAAINRRLPVLGVHGEADGAVPLSSGQSLVDTLRQQGIQAEFRSYPGMGHAYCPEEARDVSGFVARCLRTAVRPDELA